MMRVGLIIFGLFSISSSISGQSLPFYHFTSEVGLADNDVYDIAKDQSGNIWFATDNGLSKFDGQKFSSYTTKDKLAENVITGVATFGDTVLIATYRNGIQTLTKNKISPPINSKLGGFLNYCVSASSQYMITEWNRREHPNHQIKYYNRRTFNQDKLIGKPISFSTHTDPTPFYTLSKGEVYGDGKRIFTLPDFLKNKNIQCLEQDKNEQWWVVADKTLFHLTHTLAIEDKINLSSLIPNDAAFSITVDNVLNVWLKTASGKGFCIETGKKTQTINKLLKIPDGFLIRKILFDDQNQGLWIAIAGKGVYYIDKMFIKNYDLGTMANANSNVFSIGKDHLDKIWMGTENELLILENDKIAKIEIKELNHFHQILPLKNKTFLVGKHLNGKNIDLPRYFNKNQNYQIASISSSLFVWQNQLIWNHLKKFLPTKDGKITLELEKTDFNKTNIDRSSLSSKTYKSSLPYSFLKKLPYDQYNQLYNTSPNIYLYPLNNCLLEINDKTHTIEIFPKSNFFSNSKIHGVKIDKENRIFVFGEKGLGIFQNGKWILQAAERNGFDLRNALTAATDTEGRLWVGLKSGLVVLYKNRAYEFTKGNGLASSQVNTLFYDHAKQLMWVGTNDGVSVFDINKLKQARFSRPIIEIYDISSLKKSFKRKEKIELNDDDNYLSINLKTKVFQEINTAEFEYQLDHQAEWQPTTPKLVLSNLQYGPHTLAIRVKTPNGGFSDVKNATFTVNSPFYKTWLFWLLSAFTLLLIINYELKKRQRVSKEKENTTKQINELKQRGLASMMNPHFIFNSLNSIQYFINTNDMLNANEYLSQFGKLMRLNLEAAYKSNILLSDELNFLQLYLQLESIRFKNKFTFHIEVSENLSPDQIVIPTMMVQPFVENAVLHGLLPLKKDKGHIIITFFKDKNACLKITVEDNGVGINASENKSNRPHTSRALSIIKQRISLINEKNGSEKTRLQIEDLATENSRGTRVTLLMSTK
jgi:ligand-binding sensor domain-containing protein/two-component sensor histidine kinase